MPVGSGRRTGGHQQLQRRRHTPTLCRRTSAASGCRERDCNFNGSVSLSDATRAEPDNWLDVNREKRARKIREVPSAARVTRHWRPGSMAGGAP